MLLHMCYFMLPAIATTHILLFENTLNNFDTMKNPSSPKCNQLHKLFIVSHLQGTFLVIYSAPKH